MVLKEQYFAFINFNPFNLMFVIACWKKVINKLQEYNVSCVMHIVKDQLLYLDPCFELFKMVSFHHLMDESLLSNFLLLETTVSVNLHVLR